VFETAIDTILQCYLMDMEMAMSGSRQMYCTASMKNLIDENRRMNLESGENEDTLDQSVFME